MFIWMIFLESLNILLPNLVWWCSIMSQSVMQNFFCVCAVFKVRVTVRAHVIKKDSFYYIFWTVDSLAAKLSLMIHHHKLECPVKKIGWLHSGSRSQRRGKMLMFVQMVSSEPPNILCPNLVLRCIILSQNVLQKDWFASFKVKVTARAHMIKSDNSYCIFWTADPFAVKLRLIVHYHKPECFIEKLDYCVQCQGHSEGLYNQSMTISVVSTKQLVSLQPNLDW